jgi:hypothetical protein
MRSAFRGGAALAVAMLGLSGVGCSPEDKPVTVRGTVTFQGQPVTEGSVQFNSEKTGYGAEVKLGPDGTYQAVLPAGTYLVVVLPPLVEAVMKNKDTPPDTVFKKVKNIPGKYQSAASSKLSAEVAADKVVHDFELKP